MTPEFDPYYTWLGIPPEEQPADHYRLLGLRRFEENADVMRNAYDQRMSYVRKLQSGPRTAETQTVLNQLTAAKICLLDRQRKAEYDAQLRGRISTQAGAESTSPINTLTSRLLNDFVPQPPPVAASVATASQPNRNAKSSSPARLAPWIIASFLTVACLVVVVGLVTPDGEKRDATAIQNASVSQRGDEVEATPEASPISALQPTDSSETSPDEVSSPLHSADEQETTEPESQGADTTAPQSSSALRFDNGLGIEFVYCPPGESQIGSPESEEGRGGEEWQSRAVIGDGFWLGKYEVTQPQWREVMGSSPWNGKADVSEGDRFPAVYVSWDDANEFCAKLTDRERTAGRLGAGEEYALPTEVQWEYACRAHTSTAFSFGSDSSKLKDHAWFEGNAGEAKERHAREVGLKVANPWGIHDIQGNVWEWCWDAYDPAFFRREVVTYDDCQNVGDQRVIRGGAWNNQATCCRSAYRNRIPSEQKFDVGFRVGLFSRTPAGKQLAAARTEYEHELAAAKEKLVDQYAKKLIELTEAKKDNEAAKLHQNMRDFAGASVMYGHPLLEKDHLAYGQALKKARDSMTAAFERAILDFTKNKQFEEANEVRREKITRSLDAPLISIVMAHNRSAYICPLYATGSVSPLTDYDSRLHATFELVAGLSDPTAYSLRALNLPNHYLTSVDGRLRMERFDNPHQGGNGYATFFRRNGLASRSEVSFESQLHPDHFIRRRKNGEVWCDKNDGSRTFARDATFALVKPAVAWW